MTVGATFTAKRHRVGPPREKRRCQCGCQHVAGLTGRVIEWRPDIDLVIAEFQVPSWTGGPARTELCAFTIAETGL